MILDARKGPSEIVERVVDVFGAGALLQGDATCLMRCQGQHLVLDPTGRGQSNVGMELLLNFSSACYFSFCNFVFTNFRANYQSVERKYIMLPGFLESTYKRYKSDTSIFIKWLSENAKLCGIFTKQRNRIQEP